MTRDQLTRNQHFVPQCYLDKFTYDGKYLFVFDKHDQRPLTPSRVLCKAFPSQSREMEEIIQAYIVPFSQNSPFQTGGNNDASTQEKEYHIEHRPSSSIGASISSVARAANVP